MFKSQLEEFAQKAGLIQPVYESFKEGPSHEPKFRVSVTVNDNTYESLPGFSTLKAAEHAAAKAALDALLQNGCGAGVAPSPVHESGLCKNVLQEHAQKSCLPLPVYRSVRSGQEHAPTFTSTVDIGGVLYTGGPAKSKKEAEIKAARTALIAIQGEARASGKASESLPDIAQRQLGSSSVVKSSLPINGSKKREREPKSGSEMHSAAKHKKEPAKLQHQPAQENNQNIDALSPASNVIKSPRAKNGLKKKGKQPKSGSETRSAAKLKKDPAKLQHQAAQSASVSTPLGSLSVPVGSS